MSRDTWQPGRHTPDNRAGGKRLLGRRRLPRWQIGSLPFDLASDTNNFPLIKVAGTIYEPVAADTRIAQGVYDGLVKLGFDLWKPEGAFYVFPKVKNPRDFVLKMFKKYKVITYLGEWFGSPNRVRFSYALDIEKIEEGLKRIKRYLEENE